MRVRNRGLLVVLFASLCLSTVPTAVKVALGSAAAPLQLLAPRMVVGAVAIWLYLLWRRPERVRIDAHGRWHCAIAGFLNAVSLSLFYGALGRIDAGIAIVVFSIYPGFVLIMLALRGERIRPIDGIRLLLALIGVALIGAPGSGLDPIGVAMMIGCALVYSVYMIVVQTHLISYPATTSAVWVVTFMTLTVGVFRFANPPSVPLSSIGWGVVIWSGVVGTAFARIATIEGIKILGAGQTALLMPTETVMSVSWAAALLGERMQAGQLLGAGLILASVLLVALRKPRSRLPAAA